MTALSPSPSSSPLRPDARSAGRARRRPGGGILGRLLAAMRLYRQRRDLSRLSETRLRDIGLDHAEARAEARRPVWDVPSNWRG